MPSRLQTAFPEVFGTGFLGIVNAENDAVYLPLKKGRDELMLVSELGGGWGFICRIAEVENQDLVFLSAFRI